MGLKARSPASPTSSLHLTIRATILQDRMKMKMMPFFLKYNTFNLCDSVAKEPMLSERYRPIETLSADRFGETYLSEDLEQPDRSQCILKRLKLPGKNPQSLNLLFVLLKKKAETLKQLNAHPQIPKLLNYFANGRSFYWVEELVTGRLLSEELVPGQPQSEGRVIELLTEVLDILAAVHNTGLIHGRLKPSYLIRRDSDGRLVLIGFGLFKDICDRAAQQLAAPPHTSPEQKVQPKLNGADLYVAPEQRQGSVQFNSDLYALGTIAIVALTGSSEEELSTLLWENSQPTGTRAWRNGIPLRPAFAKVLDKMIHPDSQKRYQLAAEVLADLKKLQQDEGRERIAEPPAARTSAKAGKLPTVSPPSPKRSARGQPSRSEPRPKTAASSFSPPGQWLKRMSWKQIGLLALGTAIALSLFARLPQRLNSAYLQQRGLKARASGNLQQALQDYNRALRVQPNSAQTYYKRGNLRFELGDNQGAIADYSEALRLDRNYADVYINRGSARAELGDEQNAVSDYTKAIEVDGDSVAAYSNRCLSRSNLGDHPGAIEDCTKAINLQPTYTFAYQNRGLARRRFGDNQGAIADFNTAIGLDPQDAEPYYNRGLVRQQLGDHPGAIADFSAAIARNPQHILAYYDRGISRSKKGERDGAIADFQKASTLCLDAGRLSCYQDAQYQLGQLKGKDDDPQ